MPDFDILFNKVLNDLNVKMYDILYLGYSGANVKHDNQLYLIKNEGCPRCTHSYVLTLNGAKKLVEKMKTLDYPIDEIMGSMFYKSQLIGYRTSYLLSYQPWQKNDKYKLPQKYVNNFNDLI